MKARTKVELMRKMFLEGTYTIKEIEEEYRKQFGEVSEGRVKMQIRALKKEGIVVEDELDLVDGKKGCVAVVEGREKLVEIVKKSEGRKGKGMLEESEEIAEFLEEQKVKMKEKNEKYDFYLRISNTELEKVKLVGVHTTYRIVEFEEGALKGYRRKINPVGVPQGKRYPVLFQVVKGSGEPELFIMDGIALVKKEITDETRLHIPAKDKSWVWNKKLTRQIMEAMALGETIALQGEAGTGKTSTIIQIASMINQPLIRINFNGGVTNEDFIGKQQYNPEKGTYFVYGAFPLGCKLGAWIILDELDFILPEYGARLHEVFEQAVEVDGNGVADRYLTIPEHDGERLKIHPETRFLATGNAIFGDAKDRRGVHVGTQDIGGAFEDRFSRVIDIPYLNAKEESKIIRKKVKGVKRAYVNSIIQVANLVRKAFDKGELLDSFSTRREIQWAEKAVFTKNLMQSAEESFLPKLRGEDKNILKQFIATVHSEK